MTSRSYSPSENENGWSKKTSRMLINCYRKNPCLYDLKHPDYRYNDKREKAYRQIVEEMKIVKPNVTADNARKRIKTLLGQLRRERNKYLRSINNGTNTDDAYQPTLWCYKELEFLINVNDKTKGTTNIPSKLLEITEQSSTDESSEDPEAEVNLTNVFGHIPTSDNSTMNASSLQQANLVTLQVAKSATEELRTQRQQLQPTEAFCRFLCAEMQQLSMEAFNKLKINMMRLLNDALMNDLQHYSRQRIKDEVLSSSEEDLEDGLLQDICKIENEMDICKIENFN